MTLDEFSHLFINETEAITEFYKLSKGVKAGNCISLLFNPHRLSTQTSVSDGRSIYESLQDDKILNGLARLYLYNLEHNVSNPFYQTIQRGYNGIQYVNEFPPFVARSIYIQYGKQTTDKMNILDPCCGWGGRMIGAASLDKPVLYVGCEPSTKTFNGLCELGKFLQTLNPQFEYKIFNKPFEDTLNDLKKYDFNVALTSPPYYDTEKYSDEETNSLNRYKTFDDWCNGFYFPLIQNTISLIKDNTFVLNVGSCRYPLYDKMLECCDKNSFNMCEIPSYLSGKNEKFYLLSTGELKIKKIGLF